MHTIETTATVAADGSATIDEPLDVPAGRHRVVLMVDEQTTTSEAVDELGWPPGYFERTYGSLADSPLERPEQLPYRGAGAHRVMTSRRSAGWLLATPSGRRPSGER